jgi:hypothetical protein
MTTTERGTPGGTKLGDGYQCLIAFAQDADVSLWEKSVTPPGIDGGDPVDTSTMHNTTYRTKAARQLKELTNGSFTAAYDPQVYDQIVSLINVEGWITVHFPDGSTLDFMGYLKSFTPGEIVEGSQPEAECEIVCTNENSTGAETGPTYKAS